MNVHNCVTILGKLREQAAAYKAAAQSSNQWLDGKRVVIYKADGLEKVADDTLLLLDQLNSELFSDDAK